MLRAYAESHHKRVLLIVDQLEELFTLGSTTEQTLFLDALLGAADDVLSPVRVVTSMRADMLDRISAHPVFADELMRGMFLLSSPDATQLRQAIVQPLTLVDFSFEDETIVEEMLEVLQSTTGALPLLQFTASKLWELRDPHERTLTKRSYDAIGGIAGALATHADSVVEHVPSGQRALVREIFCRLVTPERTRAVVDTLELAGLSSDPTVVFKIVDRLVEARLLVVQQRGESTTVEIIHESLIGSWPAFTRWLDEDREESAFLERLQAAAKQWEASGRRPGLLWRDDSVDEAKRFVSRTQRTMTDREEAFLGAVFALANKAVRRRRLILAAMFGTLAIVAIGSIAGLLVVREAQKKAVNQAVIAKREAKRAQTAEAKIEQQLTQLQQKEQQRRKALLQSNRANRQLKTANVKIKVANVEIADKRKALDVTNARLRSALEASRQNARRALQQSRKARTAEREARRVNAQLRALLQVERRRIRALNKERRKITTELR
jgi:hypothetical protein